ncbi:MAG: polyprenyl synthetase family protein [Candidatus Azobacteroides sp.]|nr:polyprenyl synthetase family protein [Candidatus Azobacteroides sp.]
MFSFAQLTTLLSQRENQILSVTKAPERLYEPIRYMLSLGGKKIRPALVLMSCNLFSDEVEPAVDPALGIEIFHNFTLMHDDLMDRSDMRRGKPTIHKKWNDNTAILSGDAMLILAYQYVSSCKPEILSEVLNLFSTTAREVCEGQQFDMDFETRDRVTEEEYLEMIRLKTAVLLGCALKTGAFAGNADPLDARYLYDFGINIGLAFQLKDDLLDVYGDASVFGKNIGGDIVCNKKTFLLIKALEHADSRQKDVLNHWISLPAFDRDEKVRQVTEIYNQLNIKDIGEEKAVFYYKNAMDCLEKVSVEHARKQELILLAGNLMNRQF